MTGDGHHTYTDGSEYRGNFFNGTFHGIGLFWWPCLPDSTERHHYKGAWVHGKMQGQG